MSDNNTEQERAVVEALTNRFHEWNVSGHLIDRRDAVMLARGALAEIADQGYVLVERALVEEAAGEFHLAANLSDDREPGNFLAKHYRDLATRLRRAAAAGNGEGTP